MVRELTWLLPEWKEWIVEPALFAKRQEEFVTIRFVPAVN